MQIAKTCNLLISSSFTKVAEDPDQALPRVWCTKFINRVPCKPSSTPEVDCEKENTPDKLIMHQTRGRTHAVRNELYIPGKMAQEGSSVGLL